MPQSDATLPPHAAKQDPHTSEIKILPSGSGLAEPVALPMLRSLGVAFCGAAMAPPRDSLMLPNGRGMRTMRFGRFHR